jgi:hypothetical protein
MHNMKLSNFAVSVTLLTTLFATGLAYPQAGTEPGHASQHECRIESTVFDGWQAQQITNQWLKLVLVPQLGGRMMQVTFAGHPFLFVNPKYRGRYFPPVEGTRKWFNYGGDKIWPMPEGSQDDQHWPGPISDALDDGNYAFNVVSQGSQCVVRLEGPPDVRTGLQYTREISVGPDSPEILFQATMRNASTRPIRWSLQSVSQYDTTDAGNAATFNHNFWAFTPANSKSSYLDGYHVRSGVADDPSYSVKNGIFALHWLYLQGEVWVDSPAGWVAVVDGSSHFAMVERFDFDPAAEYPGKATVIFYKNGPAVEIDSKGAAVIRTSSEDSPFYMEAELNSPMVQLAPGESYTFNTKWFPTRIGSDFRTATDAGVTSETLNIAGTNDGVKLSGTVGVFFAGRLVARFTGKDDRELTTIPLQAVDPADAVTLNQQVNAPAGAERVSLRLIDTRGVDRGSLGEARIGHDPEGF